MWGCGDVQLQWIKSLDLAYFAAPLLPPKSMCPRGPAKWAGMATGTHTPRKISIHIVCSCSHSAMRHFKSLCFEGVIRHLKYHG